VNLAHRPTRADLVDALHVSCDAHLLGELRALRQKCRTLYDFVSDSFGGERGVPRAHDQTSPL
jgi:hypothetical protein